MKVSEPALQAAAPGAGVGLADPEVAAQEKIAPSVSVPGTKRGLLNKPFGLLKGASFQFGLSLPGKLWYRESQAINAKDKAVLDAALQGFL